MTALKTRLGVAAGLLLGAAMPAFAQQGLCGGVGDAGQWIGGDESMSDVAMAGSHLEQMALVLQGNEYVALFTLSQAMDVRIEAEGRGAGDPVIDVRDATGAIVISDDDSGGNGASRAEVYLEPGSYCVSMRSYDGAPMTGFVRVGQMSHEPLTDGFAAPVDDFVDPGYDPFYGAGYCEPQMIQQYLGDGPIDGVLATGGASVTASVNELQFIGFTLDTPQALTITADNPDADPIITLYDEYGGYLGENDDYEGLNSRLEISYPLTPGTYCVEMRALSDPAAPITLTVAEYDAEAAMAGMINRGEMSPPMDGTWAINDLGVLQNRIRQDIQSTSVTTWYSMDIAEGGLILIEAITNGMGDPTLVLFDDFGRQIAYNDDNGETLDSRITAQVLPGTYVVGVRQLSEGSTALTRMLFQRFIPAP